MGILELLLLAVGVSMDAFAVAICKGFALRGVRLRHCLWVGLWFGAFQALMPLAGYLLGVQFRALITAVDHWIAFALLAFLGIKMIWEALSQKQEECPDDSLSARHMLVLAIATSIDALALGVTFAFLQVQLIPAVCSIGLTTFVISAVGVKLGSKFGEAFKNKAELFGGIILIGIGLKILLEHLGILA